MKASEVLDKCISDIDKGRWICGDLARWVGKKGSPNGKHMGCAVGLVAIHSGHMDEFFTAKYVTDGEPPQEAKDAVKYLNESIPDKHYLYGRDDLMGMEGAVVDYNDSECETPAQAKKWFVAARDAAVKAGN